MGLQLSVSSIPSGVSTTALGSSLVEKGRFENITVTSFPNPIDNVLGFEIIISEGCDSKLVLYNNIGQVALESGIALKKGENIIKIPVEKELPGGIYYYRIETLGSESSGKIYKR